MKAIHGSLPLLNNTDGNLAWRVRPPEAINHRRALLTIAKAVVAGQCCFDALSELSPTLTWGLAVAKQIVAKDINDTVTITDADVTPVGENSTNWWSFHLKQPKLQKRQLKDRVHRTISCRLDI